MKRGAQIRQKKSLSVISLLDRVRKTFETISIPINGRKISLVDSLMSALAMFSLKSSSLLAFDQAKAEPIVEHNLQTLFKVQNVPCDTHMREILDEVTPRDLRKGFLSIFHEVQRGKLLERYTFLDSYLFLVIQKRCIAKIAA